MKLLRTFCFFLVVFVIFLSFVGCNPFETEWFTRNSPIHYRGSTWESEDGKVRFSVNLAMSKYHSGKIQKNDTSIEMIFRGKDSWLEIEGCSAEDFNSMKLDHHGLIHPSDAEEFEHYVLRERHAKDNYFTVEVENSSIYEKGATIMFRRIDSTIEIEVVDFMIQDYEEKIQAYTSDKTLEVSTDLETAVQQAKTLLIEKYGSVSDEVEVYYDYIELCWLVKGTHWFEPLVSVPHVLFQTDGKVLAIWEE